MQHLKAFCVVVALAVANLRCAQSWVPHVGTTVTRTRNDHAFSRGRSVLVPRQATSVQPSLGQRLERFDPSDIRCPFFRRRATDSLEQLAVCGRWLASRHKSIDLTLGLLPLSTVAAGAHARGVGAAEKARGLSLEALASRLADDFAVRHCQVTGRLSRDLYEEDCTFDGPDPDMPVTGLGKYLAASQHLFQHGPGRSRCDLLGVGVVAPASTTQGRPEERVGGARQGWRMPAWGAAPAWEAPKGGGVLVLWRIEGTVNLPWHPAIKPYYGCTLYERRRRPEEGEVDGEHAAVGGAWGVVGRATEWWSVHAWDAFGAALPPAWTLGLTQRFGEPPAPSALTILENAADEREILAALKGLPDALVQSVQFLPRETDH